MLLPPMKSESVGSRLIGKPMQAKAPAPIEIKKYNPNFTFKQLDSQRFMPPEATSYYYPYFYGRSPHVWLGANAILSIAGPIMNERVAMGQDPFTGEPNLY